MISVVVPTLNESRVIGDCLAALRSQSMPADEFEILVIDNGSADDTVEIARRFTDHVYEMPRAHVGAVRNYGARVARGSILAFLDADCIASRTWLAGASAALAEGGVAIGNKYDRSNDSGWIEALWLGEVPSGRHQTQELWSGNLVVRREAFLACGGFDETLVSYEDVLLSHALTRIGALYFDDRVRVVHLGGPKTLREFAQQQLWHGFEEWTLYRKGIKRDTLAPAMLCLLGFGLLVVSVFLGSPANHAAMLSAGILILGVPLFHCIPRVRAHRAAGWRAAVRLGTLHFICLWSKAVAIAFRFLRLAWSGRRKTFSAVPGQA